jgi:ABC-type branched-subunit amino acid transport system substrate-binding protein
MILSLSRKQELNVKGVILGLPFTFDKIITLFDQSGIPVVPSGSFSQSQLQNTDHIFPVTASLEREGQVGAEYVRQQLKATKVALFVNSSSLYSNNLANAFQSAMGDKNVTRESYMRRDVPTISNGVDDALNNHADLIYFAGDSADADIALDKLEKKNTSIPFVGGDALYELGGYTGTHYKSLYFTSFAFPDEWGSNLQHSFPTLYRLLYTGWPLDRVYGYLRPDSDAILSYDALAVLVDTSEKVISSKHTDGFSFADLDVALRNVVGNNAFQGFSGKISFASNHDDKAVVVLYVGKDGLTRMIATYGCLLVTCASA